MRASHHRPWCSNKPGGPNISLQPRPPPVFSDILDGPYINLSPDKTSSALLSKIHLNKSLPRQVPFALLSLVPPLQVPPQTSPLCSAILGSTCISPSPDKSPLLCYPWSHLYKSLPRQVPFALLSLVPPLQVPPQTSPLCSAILGSTCISPSPDKSPLLCYPWFHLHYNGLF